MSGNKVALVRREQGLVGSTPADQAIIEAMRWDQVYAMSYVQERHGPRHRAWWSMVQWAFELFCEQHPTQEVNGYEVRPNLERFRKDLIIAAGYFTATWDLDGQMRVEAQSISFASMNEGEFRDLYSRTIDVLMESVLSHAGWTREQVDAHVSTLLGYDR